MLLGLILLLDWSKPDDSCPYFNSSELCYAAATYIGYDTLLSYFADPIIYCKLIRGYWNEPKISGSVMLETFVTAGLQIYNYGVHMSFKSLRLHPVDKLWLKHAHVSFFKILKKKHS